MIKFFIILFFSVQFIFGSSTRELYEKGNEYYKQEKYKQAIDCYFKILNSGISNANVYYNLGNAYFKEKKIGYTILFYRRAIYLSPRDKEIKENLEYVRMILKDKKEEKQYLFPFILKIHNFLNLKESILFTSMLYFFIAILIFFYLCFEKMKKMGILWIIILLIFILILSGISLGYKIYDFNVPYAVVIAESVNIKSGPGFDYVTKFFIHQGAEVIIKQKRENWYEIYFSEDLIGWLPKETVEKVFYKGVKK